MKFSELAFIEKDHGRGIQARKTFQNGWEISVIQGPYSYGGTEGLYELAVLKDGDLHYDNPVAGGDVRGRLTVHEVEELATQVENYKE